ncbi:Retrovirus-related Pol polyprotein from transposon opus [Vitis vinifera]|uniref:Retrovirus-related Pol polyprotein from transposon opus n=1 Tax=Vitis vinifera TaxID=29760 RepID=A0A438FGM2_VITVI|nr:Retrovirus-related Pol polyprotein from transposon opus [Vitis vinifera]
MSIWKICLEKNAFEFMQCSCNIPTITFEECLINLEAVLNQCIEKDLVLNWEKCHFMVQQGIVLGHIISKKGIEVEKAKVELIIKLPSPTTIKKCQKSFEQLKQFLTTAPIVTASNWQLPFEVMCDASDFAIGAVLGQRDDGKPYVIYYASKTLNESQRTTTTIKKELLAVVFALEKFRAYLVGSFIVVFTDHSSLKDLLIKEDVKARLIRWILLLQEFNLQIKDKKGVENVESLMLLEDAPWYAHIANYLVTSEVPNQIIRKCVPEQEQQGILSHCHESACGGHFTSQKIAMTVFQSGFSWPLVFKDAHTMCRSCDRCQRLGKLTHRNQMPMKPILIVDLFDVWGIDFMGPFPMSFGNSYILVGVDYVSKRVEAIPCKHNDHKVVLKFLKENIFSRFGVPKAIISDGGTHFCNKPFETLLAKYGGEAQVYGIAFHLLVEVEYKAWWAIKKMMKRWHDQLIANKEFRKGQRVLLYDSRLHNFPRKLKSRWIGPFIIYQVHLNGVVELLNSNSIDTFKVNGHRLKPFLEPFNQDKEEPFQLVKKPSKLRSLKILEDPLQRKPKSRVSEEDHSAHLSVPLEHEPLHFSHDQDERSQNRVSISSKHQTESFTYTRIHV